MAAAKTVEQQVADWFAARLLRIRAGDGYAMTLSKDAIFVDGDPQVVEDPAVPFAEFQDNQGAWRDPVGGKTPSAIMEYQAAVRITDTATAMNYKRRGRSIFDDVARACFGITEAGESDLPVSVVSILPDGWLRQVRDGNYLDVTINFTVRVSADLRRRPIQ